MVTVWMTLGAVPSWADRTPLEIKADIEAIARHQITPTKDLPIKNACTMSPEFLEELKMYEWPGNVRELLTTINSVCSDAGTGSTLFPHHLPEHIRVFNIRNKFSTSNKADTIPKRFFPAVEKAGSDLTFKDHIEKMKHDYLQDLLSATRGNIKESCRRSGLSKSQLYRLMQEHNLKIS